MEWGQLVEDFCSGYGLCSCLPSGLWPGGSQGAVAEEVGAPMPDTSEPDTAAAGSGILFPSCVGRGPVEQNTPTWLRALP